MPRITRNYLSLSPAPMGVLFKAPVKKKYTEEEKLARVQQRRLEREKKKLESEVTEKSIVPGFIFSSQMNDPRVKPKWGVVVPKAVMVVKDVRDDLVVITFDGMKQGETFVVTKEEILNGQI